MNRFHCENEAAIIQALRVGGLDTEVQRHVHSCPLCSDTAMVSRFLLAETPAAAVLPDSDPIWWKAQLVGKQMAVERATRSIALVRKVSYLGVSAAALWLVFAPGHLGSMIGALSTQEIWSGGGLRGSALFVGLGAIVFALLGSLYLARSEN